MKVGASTIYLMTSARAQSQNSSVVPKLGQVAIQLVTARIASAHCDRSEKKILTAIT